MKRRDFLTKSIFIFTGALWIPKLGILRDSFARTNPYVLGTSIPGGTIIFNEQFETNPGYDEDSSGVGSNWFETNAGGGTIDNDKDRTTVTGADGSWGNECLELSGGTSDVKIYNDRDGEPTGAFYCRIELIANNLTDLPNSTYTHVAYIYDSAWGTVARISIYRDGSGNLKTVVLIDGDWVPTSPYLTFTVDTIFRYDIYYNTIADEYEVKINGVSQGTGLGDSNADVENIQLMKGTATYENVVMYFDNVQYATDGWIP